MNRETLIQLHQKGYRLSILDGVLQVQVESISSEMEIWLTQNKADLIREIARVTGKPILEYLDYSTGRYGKNKNYDGVTLNFSHVDTGESLFAYFNVGLDRQRPSKLHDAGTPLPQNQFYFGKKSHFFRFVKRCRFKLPERLSTFYQHMGQLKRIVYTALWDLDGKIPNMSLSPCTITHEDLCSSLNVSKITDQFPNRVPTKTRQKSNKFHTRKTNSVSAKGLGSKGSQRNSTTCPDNYDISKQVNKNISNSSVTKPNTTSEEHYNTLQEDQEAGASIDTWKPCPKCDGEGCGFCANSHNYVPTPKRGDRDAAWEKIYRRTKN